MKVGVLQIDDEASDEESDELKNFKRMNVNQKRDYISKMDQMKSGFMTPGMQVDAEIDRRIRDINKKFKEINFGQDLTHETFEYFKPKRLDPVENAYEYRTWKLRQIILKQHQFEERINRFENNLDKFKVNKERIVKFRTLAKKGYDKTAAIEKDT